MNELFELFQQWTKHIPRDFYPYLKIYSDGSGALCLVGWDREVFNFSHVSDGVAKFKELL